MAIEKQTELHPLPKTSIDWKEVNTSKFEFTIGDARNSKENVYRSAREGFQNQLSKEQFTDLNAKVIHKGFDFALLRTGDKVTLEDKVLYIDTKDQRLALPLVESAAIKPDYKKLEAGVVKHARRSWEALKEAVKHGILTEFLAAQADGDWKAASFKNRTNLWESNKLGLNLDNVPEGDRDNYRGTKEQNRALLRYLAGKVEGGEEVDIAPKAKEAPAESPHAKRRRARRAEAAPSPAKEAPRPRAIGLSETINPFAELETEEKEPALEAEEEAVSPMAKDTSAEKSTEKSAEQFRKEVAAKLLKDLKVEGVIPKDFDKPRKGKKKAKPDTRVDSFKKELEERAARIGAAFDAGDSETVDKEIARARETMGIPLSTEHPDDKRYKLSKKAENYREWIHNLPANVQVGAREDENTYLLITPDGKRYKVADYNGKCELLDLGKSGIEMNIVGFLGDVNMGEDSMLSAPVKRSQIWNVIQKYRDNNSKPLKNRRDIELPVEGLNRKNFRPTDLDLK